ncbi:hypothetical protein [Sphingobacterium endophyticum]|uniref:hypothetical protein n=1 Tax=Sphingobacterium endophyticum TaxID=2546448 RepID=UPI0012E1B294|nr:hypothetical protein [Sphingobacterium endophyticum]
MTLDNEKKVVTSADLENYQKHTIYNIQITSHLKEYRLAIKNVKGKAVCKIPKNDTA